MASIDLSTEIADVHKFFPILLKYEKLGKKFSLLLSYFFNFKIVVVDKESTFLLISYKNCYKSIAYDSSTLVCDCASTSYPE